MKKLLWLTLAASLTLSGCYMASLDFNGLDEGSVMMTPLPGTTEQHFQEQQEVSFLFWGLVPLDTPRPADALRRYIGSGRKIANLRATIQQSFIDSLLSWVTLGIYGQETIEYEGDVVHVELATRSKSRTTGGAAAASGPAVTTTTTVAPVIAPVFNNAGSAGSQETLIGSTSPVLGVVNANPALAKPGDQVALQAVASSPVGRSLTFTWSAGDGILSSTTGPSVYWRAPGKSGVYPIMVTVTDDRGGQSVGTVNVFVTP